MVRHALALGQPQELAQREAVGASPFEATFAVEAFEPGRDQHRLQLVVKNVTRRPWQVRPRHQHVRLPNPLSTKSHPKSTPAIQMQGNRASANSSTGC